MKNRSLIIVILVIISYNLTQENGIKLDISQDVLEGIEKQFLPILAEELNKVNVTNSQIFEDPIINKIRVHINDVNFSLENIKKENVLVTFKEPNLINVKTNGITGKAYFKIVAGLAFLKDTENVFIKVSDVRIDADLQVISALSRKDLGKSLPSAAISRFDINVDYDFDVFGNSFVETFSFISKFAIKDYIDAILKTKIKDIILKTVNNYISDFVENQSVFVPLEYKNLMLDISLLSLPRIIDGHLFIHVNGTVLKRD